MDEWDLVLNNVTERTEPLEYPHYTKGSVELANEISDLGIMFYSEECRFGNNFTIWEPNNRPFGIQSWDNPAGYGVELTNEEFMKRLKFKINGQI